MKYFKKKNFQKEPRVTFTRYHTSAVSVIVGETKENPIPLIFDKCHPLSRAQSTRFGNKGGGGGGDDVTPVSYPSILFARFSGNTGRGGGGWTGKGEKRKTQRRGIGSGRGRVRWSKGRKFARRLFSGSPNLKNGILPLCGESRREVRISLRAATRGKRGGEAWWRDGRVINEYSQ